MSYSGKIIDDTMVSNWPVGISDSDQESIIDRCEELIEKITKIKFYQDDLDIYLDGNSKNRLFLPLHSDILEIDTIEVYGQALDTSIWTHDKRSVYIAEDAISTPEYKYMMSQYNVIFPYGTNNIHITGHIGTATAPESIKRACIILAESENDNSLYTMYAKGSESMGRYSVSYQREVLSGIYEADLLLDKYVSKRGFYYA